MKRKAKVAFIVSDYHQAIAQAMESAALEETKRHELVAVGPFRVTGSYEVPLLAQTLLARKDIEAVVVLGFIEKGETLHGHVMGQVVSEKLLALSLTAKKPVGIGIIGPGATLEQAQTRKVGYAQAAVKVIARGLLELKRAKKK
jgi:6,7-dimethyl-8-ribityllumazine synthase